LTLLPIGSNLLVGFTHTLPGPLDDITRNQRGIVGSCRLLRQDCSSDVTAAQQNRQVSSLLILMTVPQGCLSPADFLTFYGFRRSEHFRKNVQRPVCGPDYPFTVSRMTALRCCRILSTLPRLDWPGLARDPIDCLPRMAEGFWRGSSKLCQGACPRQRRPSVGLDRVCARATLPLSGQAGFLKADSKTQAVILLGCLRDFLLRCHCLLRVDLLHLCGLL